jgi:hypothetical protein
MTVVQERGYEAIKALARKHGQPINKMLALAAKNDPFFCGSPAQRINAEWFGEILNRLGLTSGFHIRRIHYQVAVSGIEKRPDGRPYENTDECWNFMGEASKAARYLGLVKPDDVIDRRNPDPKIHADYESAQEPAWGLDLESLGPCLPAIRAGMERCSGFEIPAPWVEGYDYRPGDQPYHLEVWIEKSTMDDVLIPVCQDLGINLVTSVGFQSITAAIALLKRLARIAEITGSGKAARIFYISDFDPAGDQMPVAVARQIEFWLPQYAPDADVRLVPLALTQKQAEDLELPRIPIKDTDQRKANFEKRCGEGAVELDALEALHPGELERIVRDAAAPYRDDALAQELRHAEARAERQANEAWDKASEDSRRELTIIGNQAREIEKKYEDLAIEHLARLDDLNADLQKELEPVRGRLEAVRQAVERQSDNLRISLPDRPEATIPASERFYFFDSKRIYEKQLFFYQCRKHLRGQGSPPGAATR